MKTLKTRIMFILMSFTMFSVCTIAGLIQPAREAEVIVTHPSYGNQDDNKEDQDEEVRSEGEGAGDPPHPEPDEDTDVSAPVEVNAQYVRSKVGGLQIRSGPGSSYSSMGYLDKDDMVTLLEREGDWYKTLYKNKTAYISASNSYTEIYSISLSEYKNEVVEKIIEEGLRLLGFPYIYGATRLHDGSGKLISSFDKTKYDCSSLMQYIYYYGANINLNMTTRTQVTQGKHVARSDIKRGDLMFFTNSTRYNKTGVERIGHVALYLGNNYILHTASDYAVIEQISATRWKYYIESRTFF